MSKTLYALTALALLAGGCHNEPTETAMATGEHMHVQPVVSVVPIIDHTKNSYDWNLSDELSSTIYTQICQKDRLSLNHSSQVRAETTPLLSKYNPFGTDLSWMKTNFHNEEFIAFLELVEHEEVLNQNKLKPQDPHTCSAQMHLSMRVRVVDLRHKEPKVILQELIQDVHHIPAPFNSYNFYQVSWKDPSFDVSPIGQAHNKLTKQISERIEDYILTATRNG